MSMALAIGGLLVPEDEPGVAAGLIDGVIDGWPSPGVRLVEQPNTTREQANTAAVMPPRKRSVFLSIVPPVGAANSGLLRATSEPGMRGCLVAVVAELLLG
jgi:hypothetical protein